MIKTFRHAFDIPELRKRILFTALLLIVYRLGAHITFPGISDQALEEFFNQLKDRPGGNVIGFVDPFSGGAFKQMTIFALGIQPYISAWIIMQLLSGKRLYKEPESREKIIRYIRYLTVILSAFYGLQISFVLKNSQSIIGQSIPIITNPTIWWHCLVMITVMAGATFVMWLSEQITERGIGNGILWMLVVDMLSGMPSRMAATVLSGLFDNSSFKPLAGFDLLTFLALIVINITEWGHHVSTRLFDDPSFGFLEVVISFALIVITIMGAVYIQLTVRKIPVQYADGRTTHLALQVNVAFPIIFASPLAVTLMQNLSISPESFLYVIIYALLIIGFMHLHVAVQMNPLINPIRIAEVLKNNDGFIPEIPPGKMTVAYINTALTRITLSRALLLGAIAVVPIILQWWLGIIEISRFGTSILIVVGFVLDTVSQFKSYIDRDIEEGKNRTLAKDDSIRIASDVEQKVDVEREIEEYKKHRQRKPGT